MVFYFNELNGGYSTNLPPEQMEGKMLSTAENVYWKSALRKRQGKSVLATSDISASVLHGQTRAYINSTWYTITARENASGDVNFYYGLDSGGTLTAIDNTYDWASGEVEMAVFGSFVVAVNGANKPAIIYYDAGWQIENLEEYDTRDRADSDWWAGQYDDSETGDDMYVDDTTDAQGASVDFQYASTATNDGFWIACSFTFNKVTFADAEDSGTVDVTYQYYTGDDTWATCDLVTTPDWSTGATADVTLEFNIPTDWEAYDGDSDNLNNRYAVRGKFSTPPAAAKSCGEIKLYHTQYLSQIMAGAYPKHVTTHLNRLYLSEGNNVNYSPPERLTGWNDYDVEVFTEGGDEVQAMRSMGDYLAVLKEAAIYGYFGNVWTQREVRLLSTKGTIRGWTAQVVNDSLLYLAHDGIYLFASLQNVNVSKHILDDLDGYTKTNACAVSYNGEYWIGFPSNDVVLWCDPDTFRRDDRGDGRLSFYKFTGLSPKQMVWHNGADDDNYLTAIEGTNIYRYQDGNYADGTTDIAVTIKLKPHSFGKPLKKKRYTRAKIETSKAGSFTFTAYGEYDEVSTSVTEDSGSGTGHYDSEFSLPYTLDGKNIALEYSNTGSTDVTFYGFALEAFERRY